MPQVTSRWLPMKQLTSRTTSRCALQFVGWTQADDVHETALGLVRLPDTKPLTFIRCHKRCAGEVFPSNSQLHWSSIRWSSKYERRTEWCQSSCEERGRTLSVCPLLCQQLEFVCPGGDKKLWVVGQLHEVHIPACETVTKFSPKRLNLFKTVRKDITLSVGGSALPPAPALRNLCPTRWTVRHSAIAIASWRITRPLCRRLKLSNRAMMNTLPKAKAYWRRWNHLRHFSAWSLLTWSSLQLKKLSTNLQGKNTTVAEGMRGAQLLRSDSAIHVRKVTNVRTIADTLNQSEMVKGML